jgi:hypothetical protein
MDPLAELVVVDKERTQVEEFLIRRRRWVGTVVKKQVLGLFCGLVFLTSLTTCIFYPPLLWR